MSFSIPIFHIMDLSQCKIQEENQPEEKDQTWEEFAVVG